MGGLGSGYFRERKVTVEKCLCLDVNYLAREGFLKGKYARKDISWYSESGEEVHRVEIEVMPGMQGFKHIGISHYAPENKMSMIYYQPISLDSTKLPSGGKRWWFLCPGAGGLDKRKKCDKRVGKLYLPPGKRDFACRECYDLTYESCQKGHSVSFL